MGFKVFDVYSNVTVIHRLSIFELLSVAMINPKRTGVKKETRLGSVFRLASLVFGLILVWNLGRGVWEVRVAYRRLDEARSQLAGEEDKRIELEAKLAEVLSPAYVEKIARNKLAMQRTGELVVLIEDGGNEKEKGGVRTEEVVDEPNYLKWWRLIN